MVCNLIGYNLTENKFPKKSALFPSGFPSPLAGEGQGEGWIT